MHELAIAESVVRIAERHADGRRVTKVYLKVGHLRQVVPRPSPSASSWWHRKPGRRRGAGAGGGPGNWKVPRLRIGESPGELPLQCKACGGFDLEIVAGEELYVESLEIEDQTETETDT